MDIAAATLGGIGQNGVHQCHDRRIHRGLLQLLKIDVVALLDNLHLAVAELFEHVVVAHPAKTML